MATVTSSSSLGKGSMMNDGDAPTVDTSAADDTDNWLGNEAPLLSIAEEKAKVQELWQALTAEERASLPDRQMLIRHIRAEKGHIEKAIVKCKAALKWRQEFGVEDIVQALQKNTNNTKNDKDETDNDLAQSLRQENSTGKIYVRGYDGQGRALMYMRPARENTNDEANNMKHLVWNLEKAIACTHRKSSELLGNQSLEKIILLIDYEGFSLAKAPPLSTTKLTLDILQNMYPERMFRAYCLHPPFIFKVFWNMARPFIDPITKEKIVFLQKSNAHLLMERCPDPTILEKEAGGMQDPNDFDSTTYMNLPMDRAFGESY